MDCIVIHITHPTTEAPSTGSVRNGVISQTAKGKRGKGRTNLTWKESVKRDLKNWTITKELALDRRE
jgi:hypothetical protein